MRRRARGLLVLALALAVTGGLIVADVVTLSKAKPSFDHETRAFQRLLQSTSTTVASNSIHHAGSATTTTTTLPSTSSTIPATQSTTGGTLSP